MLAIFGPESALYPAASFAQVAQVLHNPLAPKYLAEGDGYYEDHRLMQRAMNDLAEGGGGELLVTPAVGRNGQALSYAWKGRVVIPSGVRIRGVGNPLVKAVPGYGGGLFQFEDDGYDQGLEGLVLDIGGPSQPVGAHAVMLGRNGRRTALDCRILNPKNQCVNLPSGTRLYDLRVGRERGAIDPRAMGAWGGAVLPYDVVMMTGSAVATAASAPFSADMVGMVAEVPRAGGPDGIAAPNGGYRTLVTTVAAYLDPQTILLSNAALSDAPGVRAAFGWDDTIVWRDAVALSAASLSPVTPGVDQYLTSTVNMTSGASLIGSGKGLSILRARALNATVSVLDAYGVTLRGFTAEGYGPDAGPVSVGAPAGTFHPCVSVMHSQQIVLEDIHARFGTAGFTITNGSDHTVDNRTRFIRYDGLMASSITNANGTGGYSGATLIVSGGTGLWFFNAVMDVVGGTFHAHQVSRHGWFADAGTSSSPGIYGLDPAHGDNENFTIGEVNVTEPGHPGPIDGRATGGVAVGMVSGKHINIAVVNIDAPYFDPALGTAVDGIIMGGDQNGEWSSHCAIGTALIRRVAGQAVAMQGQHCRIGQLDIEDYNLAENTSYARPLLFGSYPYSTASTLPPADVTDNEILSASISHPGELTATDGVQDRQSSDGSIDIGVSAITVNSPTLNFTAADVGRGLRITGAGPGGDILVARILTCVSATAVTIDRSAQATVSGRNTVIGRRLMTDYAMSAAGGLANPDGSGLPSRTAPQGAIAAGSNVLDCATAAFINDTPQGPLHGDVGRWIWLGGAGVAAGNFTAQIVTVVSPTQVTLDRLAVTTVVVGDNKTLTIGRRLAGLFRNRVRLIHAPHVRTGYLASGGGAFGPSVGADANFVGAQATAPTSGLAVQAARLAGDQANRYEVLSQGLVRFGDGVTTPDVSLSRSAAGVLAVNGQIALSGVSGNLVVTGSVTGTSIVATGTPGTLVAAAGFGVNGVGAKVRPAALVQTYATADRTLGAYTPDTESSAYTGAADGEAKLADLQALRVAYENLRAFVEDLAQHHNVLVDDLQAYGLEQ